MKLLFRRSLAIVMAFALFLGILHIPPASAASSSVRDGEFDVPFRYLKDGSTETSAADTFMVKNSGKLIIKDGKAVFEHQVTKANYSTFEYFGSRNPGKAKAVITSSGGVESVNGLDGYTPAVSGDAASPNNDNVVIRLEIEDVYSLQDIVMHINDKENIFGANYYNHWYNAQLQLQLDGIDLSPLPGGGDGDGGNGVITRDTFNSLVSAANLLLGSAVEGEADGQYKTGSIAELQAKLTLANALAADDDYLEVAYKTLDTAVKNFKNNVVVVNKAALSRWILEAKTWLAKDPKDSGFAESGIASSLRFGAAYSEGEYPSEFPAYEEISYGVPLGLTAKVRRELAAAETLFQDAAATQTQVNTMVYEKLAKYNWEDIEKQRYSKKSEAEIYVLDSIAEGTNILSQYAGDFADTAELLQQEGYLGTFANITIHDDPNDSIDYTGKSIAQSSPRSTDGLFGPANSANPGKPVTLSSTATEKVFQSYVRSAAQPDSLWQGFVRIRYPMTYADNKVTEIAGVTKTVFISFNAAQHKELLSFIDQAQQLHDKAVEGTGVGQYPTGSKATLQTAIDSATTSGGYLAAPRPKILTATTDLQTALDTFKAAAITSPTDPGTPPVGQTPKYPEDGNYYMNFRILKDGTDEDSIMSRYVNTRALVNVSGGAKSVSFTLKQSKEITGLTLNGSSGSVSSANTANNTRVATFQLPSLSSKINGWVDVNWPEINYVHNYDVQFLFSESSAVYAGENPSVPGGSGNVGPPPGLEVPGKEEEAEGEGEGSEEPATTVQFSDINKHWAKANIEAAVKLGIVNGFTDGSFRPENTVSRGEFAVMISRALMLEGEDSGMVFQDAGSIPGWAKDHIARAIAAGLMQGFADDTFRVSDQLSRAQLAVIIARAASLKLDGASSANFTDSAAIPAWASKEVAAAVDAGLIQGKDNRFAPNETATRAEAITMIMRLLAFFEKK
ncbi:S-layer homology domain-containing protein [Paenibacillus glycanilyticus]|uniref:Uncharacterized protein n=1 Tax=Paenibacillus glycanilyticus TaxID=126569 RepID=A0ABQ6GA56_9BACL|nr:S-layer homology domain-containing protein [Paenibacillus glycanilyticus]GLX66557.1 hypothetical protein MU1_09010 [Paenibacillus glycanilyticus]